MSWMLDQCDICGGGLEAGKTSLKIWRDGSLIVLSDVPADVCRQCKESYLSAETSEKIDHFLSKYKQHKPKRYIPVPEFSAAQAFGKSPCLVLI